MVAACAIHPSSWGKQPRIRDCTLWSRWARPSPDHQIQCLCYGQMYSTAARPVPSDVPCNVPWHISRPHYEYELKPNSKSRRILHLSDVQYKILVCSRVVTAHQYQIFYVDINVNISIEICWYVGYRRCISGASENNSVTVILRSHKSKWELNVAQCSNLIMLTRGRSASNSRICTWFSFSLVLVSILQRTSTNDA